MPINNFHIQVLIVPETYLFTSPSTGPQFSWWLIQYMPLSEHPVQGPPDPPGVCKNMKSPPTASRTFALLSQCPDVVTAAATLWRDSRRGGMAIRSLASPESWVLVTGKQDRGLLPSFHQGISGICIKLEPKPSFSKAPHTIIIKKPKQVFKSGKSSIVMKK